MPKNTDAHVTLFHETKDLVQKIKELPRVPEDEALQTRASFVLGELAALLQELEDFVAE